jgi:sigma-E factor negative regulatory protein RseC
MIEEQAIVTRIAHNQVWVKRLHSGGCSGCAQQSTCGTSALSQFLPKREFAVDCASVFRVGDHVNVAIDDSHLLFSSVLLYLLPLVVMLASVTSARHFFPSELIENGLPFIALASLLASYYLLNRLQMVLLLYFCFKPQIVAKSS